MRFLRSFTLWRDQQINLFSFFGLLAAPGVSRGPPGASWGSSGGPPGSLLGLMLNFLNPIWALQGFNCRRTFQSSTLISRIVLTICWRSDMTLVQLSPHRWLWRRARLACPATYSRTCAVVIFLRFAASHGNCTEYPPLALLVNPAFGPQNLLHCTFAVHATQAFKVGFVLFDCLCRSQDAPRRRLLRPSDAPLELVLRTPAGSVAGLGANAPTG